MPLAATLWSERTLWFYGREPRCSDPAIGPLKSELLEAMHSLRQQVVRTDASLSSVPFWSAVVFPYFDFNTASDEWHTWQVIAKTRFRRQSLATLIRDVLRRARSHLGSCPSSMWFREADRIPNQQQSGTR